MIRVKRAKRAKRTKRANRAIRSLKRVKEQFTLFCQKTSDSLEKPKSEFPTLSLTLYESPSVVGQAPGHSQRIACDFCNPARAVVSRDGGN